jgi:hypothetical protein
VEHQLDESLLEIHHSFRGPFSRQANQKKEEDFSQDVKLY